MRETKGLIEDKKGLDIMLANIIFILANVLIFAVFFIFVARAGSGVGFYEQQYAKKIALLIDDAEPGMRIEVDISKLLEIAEKEKFEGEIISIDNDENLVRVKLKEGKGYEFTYFSDVSVGKHINRQKGRLILEIK